MQRNDKRGKNTYDTKNVNAINKAAYWPEKDIIVDKDITKRIYIDSNGVIYPNNKQYDESAREYYNQIEPRELKKSDKLKLVGILSNFWKYPNNVYKGVKYYKQRFDGFADTLKTVFENRRNAKPLTALLELSKHGESKDDDDDIVRLRVASNAMNDIAENTGTVRSWNYNISKGSLPTFGMRAPLAAYYSDHIMIPTIEIVKGDNNKYEPSDDHENTLNERMRAIIDKQTPQGMKNTFKNFNMSVVPYHHVLLKDKSAYIDKDSYEIDKNVYKNIVESAGVTYARDIPDKVNIEDVDEEEEVFETDIDKDANTSHDKHDDEQTTVNNNDDPIVIDEEEEVEHVNDNDEHTQDEHDEHTTEPIKPKSDIDRIIDEIRKNMNDNSITEATLRATSDQNLDKRGLDDKYSLIVKDVTDLTLPGASLRDKLKFVDDHDISEPKLDLEKRYDEALQNYAIKQRKDELQNMLLKDRFTMPEMFLNKFTADLENDLTSSDEFRTTLDELKQNNPEAYKQTINRMALKMWKYYKQLRDDDKRNINTVNYSMLYRELNKLRDQNRANHIKQAFNNMKQSTASNTIYSPQQDRSKPYAQHVEPTRLAKITMRNSKLHNNAANMQRHTYVPASYQDNVV